MRPIPGAATLSLWLTTRPPLLASIAAGAVAVGVIAKFADHRVEQAVHDHSDSYGAVEGWRIRLWAMLRVLVALGALTCTFCFMRSRRSFSRTSAR